MGNSTATGHMVTMTNVHQAVGIKNALQALIWQHNIEPWAVNALTHSNPLEKLRKQAEVRRISPFRFISVDEGLAHFSQHAGGWVVQLTREKFTQLSLQLFQSKGLRISVEDAKVFYDVFDCIDMYGDATLNIGELVGGLSTFFAGTLDQRSKAVCEALDPQSVGQIPKSLLSEFFKPYVWSLVPDSAAVLRPILLSHVTDEIFVEMNSASSVNASYVMDEVFVTVDEFARWVRLAHPKKNAAQMNDFSTPPVFASAIFERCAAMIEAVLHEAWKEFESKEALREYGQQKWETEHGGQTQRLHDVGMYRYVVSNFGSRTTGRTTQVNHITFKQGTPQNIEEQEVPSIVGSVVGNMSKQVQEAMGVFNLGACRSPSTTNDSEAASETIIKPVGIYTMVDKTKADSDSSAYRVSRFPTAEANSYSPRSDVSFEV